jgi:uncharacterized membrane protein
MKQLATLFLACFFSFLMLRITLPYMGLRYDVGFLLTKQSILHKEIWRYAFYIHIATSIFVLLFGGIQFANIKTKPLHRLLGKFYVAIVLFAAAPSGFIMALYANGGLWARIAFVIASVLWWIITWLAYVYIRKGEIEKHRRMMYYSYALTLSAITLRTYALMFPLLFHLHAKEMYILIAWMGWVPNLLVAWLLNRRKKITVA